MLQIGEVFIYGLNTEMARTIMSACATLGIDRQIVRTTDMGFIVPAEVADEVERIQMPDWSGQEAVF